MKDRVARTALATWVAISLLAGVTTGFLRLTNVPSDRLYDSTLDGNAMAVAAIASVGWSLLTFVCGTPLMWAVVALRTRGRSRKVGREAGRGRYHGTGKLG